MLLTVPKQSWCHFEALECIFHFGYEIFSFLSSADSQSRKESVPELMVNPVQDFSANSTPNNRDFKKHSRLLDLSKWRRWQFNKTEFLAREARYRNHFCQCVVFSKKNTVLENPLLRRIWFFSQCSFPRIQKPNFKATQWIKDSRIKTILRS